MTMRILGWRLSLCVALFAAGLCSAKAAEAVSLIYEYASSPGGPWQTVDPAKVQVGPTGNVTVEKEGANVFFRLRVVSSAGGETTVPVVTLAQIPAGTVNAAKIQLVRMAAGADSEFGDLSEVDIAPFAAPLLNAPGDKGPSYYEFKLVRKPRTVVEAGFRKFNSNENGETARGYMIASATTNDLPVVEFATEGGSPVESLLAKCGGVTPARVIRYGAGFWVAENEKGELIANHGTEPFRPPAGIVEELAEKPPVTGAGDTDAGLHEPPPASKLVPTHYRSYEEFKQDYETNKFHQVVRSRRAENAKAYWNAERGIFPQVLRVVDGQTTTFLAGVRVDNLILDVELGDRPIANVTAPRIGGLSVQGLAPGRMGIKVRTGERVTRYVIEVTAPRLGAASVDDSLMSAQATAEPFWKTVTEAYAGGWGDQMRWWQMEDSEWCNLVGCGPVALGMLLGWWENEKSVESAFYTAPNSFLSLRDIDAARILDTTSRKAKVRAAYVQLHELCDVICDPFSQAGATMPGDLVEGFFGYLQPVASSAGISSALYGKGQPLVGYTYSYAYDAWGDDWDSSGSRVANGIKAGRPGVVGLGVLWHYVVAYGYMRQDYTMKVGGEDVYLGVAKRFFKVNEGWNKSNPAWYSAHDVFLGLTANIYQKQVPTQP